MGIELKPQIKRRKTREEDEQYDGTTEFIAFEILTRLPVKSLVKCKSVCRSWRSLISDPVFIAAHLKRSGENPQLIIAAFFSKLPRRGIDMYTYEERKKRARFLFGEEFVSFQEHMFLPQHCNGLVLLNTTRRLVVCNPSTKELVALPSDNRGDVARMRGFKYTTSLGYVEGINLYKVARYFFRDRNYHLNTLDLGFEVLTLGFDTSWRIIEDPPYPTGSRVCPRSVGEVIYFIIDNSLHHGPPKAFLCFNLRVEKFRVVDPPYQCPIDYNNMSIVNLEGNPCFVHQSQDRRKCKMWISRDFIEHVWIPTFSFDLMQPPRLLVPLAFRHGKLLLEIETPDEVHRLEYYDPQSEVFDPVVCIAEDLAFYNKQKCGYHFFHENAPFAVVNFVESLVPILPKS
ncbi:putative F-box protein At3g23960 [Asparagus officinalis]|uniref:putative F-box protein At3g23960 n=1 Tax=Asparagus officinalis TaxID=4686 RepID=UPI00098E62E1|nr:putative F-box protein At3g23960 [Asparagus officinalis]XP_020270354.1 putative F-box protein At3g23960 [Asparagus officinalis]XP_020270355.1 putative F-box protein At3g23960 [Asparagus officinalis]XP_020270356.1 putative F-box protein At3g23960 [Asparagus officinalis]XP_020270357.1 putative F-box protein At3g23960 [Asparagus officinalis]XP_020270358.1 putative F-box protein At3g23960 [Asparagus officinalis]XP_020270359.1 putative F-box protein At3g23960 [Asparagus officinalis]XP_02027036